MITEYPHQYKNIKIFGNIEINVLVKKFIKICSYDLT
jgi:hypothetical protein